MTNGSRSRSSRQLLPVGVRSIHGQGQTAVRPGEHRVLHESNPSAADLLQRGFEGLREIADQSAAAGENDVVADTLLELRLDPREEIEHRFYGRSEKSLAGGAQLVRDVELRGNALN